MGERKMQPPEIIIRAQPMADEPWGPTWAQRLRMSLRTMLRRDRIVVKAFLAPKDMPTALAPLPEDDLDQTKSEPPFAPTIPPHPFVGPPEGGQAPHRVGGSQESRHR